MYICSVRTYNGLHTAWPRQLYAQSPPPQNLPHTRLDIATDEEKYYRDVCRLIS